MTAGKALCAVLFLGCALSGCEVRCGGPPNGGTTAGFNTIAPSGPEIWNIDGTPHAIARTYYLDLPEGFQFTVDIPVDVIPPSQEAAIDQAWPIIRYVFRNGIYQRSSINGPGGAPRHAGRIGVVLFRRDGASTHGIRANVSIGDIKARLDAEPDARAGD